MSAFNFEDSAAMVTITGWVQVVKRWLPETLAAWMPLVAILCGVMYATGAKPGGTRNLVESIVLGVMLGLSACGTFEVAKNAAEKMKPAKP